MSISLMNSYELLHRPIQYIPIRDTKFHCCAGAVAVSESSGVQLPAQLGLVPLGETNHGARTVANGWKSTLEVKLLRVIHVTGAFWCVLVRSRAF